MSSAICLCFVAAATLLLSACSGEVVEERTFKQDLELRLGRTLSPSEVTEYKESAEILCSVDAGILDELWNNLDEEQFKFQTFVFTVECPEREALYRQERLSGKPTSTTRPPGEPTPGLAGAGMQTTR